MKIAANPAKPYAIQRPRYGNLTAHHAARARSSLKSATCRNQNMGIIRRFRPAKILQRMKDNN